MSIILEARTRRGDFELDVAFQTEARSIGVVGPSGSGKTTLLHALAGLTPVLSGRLVLDGLVVMDTQAGHVPPAHQRAVGYVFQDGRLFPHLTVGGNVAFGGRYVADPVPVQDALALVDLDGFQNRWPASLSGGEARRVAIARALATRPSLLLLDEPFAGLDAGRRERLLPYLIRLRDEIRTPLIIVSHDDRDVEALCNDVLRLDRGKITARHAEPTEF